MYSVKTYLVYNNKKTAYDGLPYKHIVADRFASLHLIKYGETRENIDTSFHFYE